MPEGEVTKVVKGFDWLSFVSGVIIGALLLAAPIGLGVRWIFRKAKSTFSNVPSAP